MVSGLFAVGAPGEIIGANKEVFLGVLVSLRGLGSRQYDI